MAVATNPKPIKKVIRHIYHLVDSQIHTKLRLRKLKNDEFSIISNCCIAGLMYHKLSKKMLSPTINLFLKDRSAVLDFAEKIKDYMGKEIEFGGGYNYPFARISDLDIHFLHYSSEKEAHEKWELRKKRINYSNMYLVLWSINGLTEEEYDRTREMLKINGGQYNNVCILSSFNATGKYDVKLNKPGQWFDETGFGRALWEDTFDYIGFLNQRS